MEKYVRNAFGQGQLDDNQGITMDLALTVLKDNSVRISENFLTYNLVTKTKKKY